MGGISAKECRCCGQEIGAQAELTNLRIAIREWAETEQVECLDDAELCARKVAAKRRLRRIAKGEAA